MRLSVIIPCYNAAETIAAQLEALSSQDWPHPWEIIVVDNNSRDRTVELVKQFQPHLANLRLVEAAEKQGSAYARNVGARAAVGEALLFCDGDDEVAPGWVMAMGQALQQYECVAGRLEAEKLNEADRRAVRHCPQQQGLQTYDYPPFLPHAATANLGLSKALHEKIGGFDESMRRLVDTDYCWRLQLAGTKIHFVPEAVVHYRFRESLRETYSQAYLWGKYNVLLYKKYRPLGMPALTWRDGLLGWTALLRQLPRAVLRRRYARWMRRLAWRAGRLNGSITYRVVAF